jgi:hypothetical protein
MFVLSELVILIFSTMTTSELKTLIASSPEPDRYNSIKVVFEFKYINYRNEINGLSAIQEFVRQQIEGFTTIGEKKLPTVARNSINYFSQVLKAVEQFSISNEKFDQNNYSYAERALQSSLGINGNYYPFLFNCPETEFLIKIQDKFPSSYEGAYHYFIGNYFYQSKDGFIGYMLAHNFNKSLDENKTSLDIDKKLIQENKKFYEKYLSESESQLSDFLKNSKVLYDKHVADMDSFKTEKETLFTDWFGKSSELFAQFFKNSNESYEATIQASNEKIKRLENTYEELLRLKKPAEYWATRAAELKKQGWRSLYWLIGLVVLTAALLFCLLFITPDEMLVTIFSDDKSKAIRWSIVFVAFLYVLIYGIRTLNKVTFSSFHLARDAEERYQLTHVYLALINEKAMEKEDRMLVMQSLFSRADTGLLKEDSSPSMPGAANVLERIVK